MQETLQDSKEIVNLPEKKTAFNVQNTSTFIFNLLFKTNRLANKNARTKWNCGSSKGEKTSTF